MRYLMVNSGKFISDEDLGEPLCLGCVGYVDGESRAIYKRNIENFGDIYLLVGLKAISVDTFYRNKEGLRECIDSSVRVEQLSEHKLVELLIAWDIDFEYFPEEIKKYINRNLMPLSIPRNEEPQ